MFWTALGEALATFGLVAGAFLAMAKIGWLEWDPFATILLASTAACTAPLQRLLGTPEKGEHASVELAHFCSRLDDLPGLLALGLLFSVTPPRVGAFS